VEFVALFADPCLFRAGQTVTWAEALIGCVYWYASNGFRADVVTTAGFRTHAFIPAERKGDRVAQKYEEHTENRSTANLACCMDCCHSGSLVA